MQYCKFDTVKCSAEQECCKTHIKEIRAYLEKLFQDHQVNYLLHDYKTIRLDPMDYSKVMSLSKEIEKKGHPFKAVSHQYLCCIFYSKTNKNFIQLVYTLDSHKYIESSHEIKNQKILTWAYDALIRTIDSFEYHVHHPLLDGSHEKEGRHPFMPYNISWFIHHLQDAYDLCQRIFPGKQYKFLEIGCGVGTKTKVASQLFEAYAIEVFEPYAAVAKEITKKRIRRNFGIYHEENDINKIFMIDALAYKDFEKFDVIYCYCPFNDYEKELELENKIFDQAKEGTVFILVWPQASLPENIRKTSAPSGEIYVKMSNQKDFELLENYILNHLVR